MKFPLYCECLLDDLFCIPFDMTKFDRDVGFIYLLQYEGRTKVGYTQNPAVRGAFHSRTLISHGILFDKIFVSQPIRNAALIEKHFHFLLRKLRREGTREVYNDTPERLIELFDLDCVIASPLTPEEISARRARRAR